VTSQVFMVEVRLVGATSAMDTRDIYREASGAIVTDYFCICAEMHESKLRVAIETTV